MAWVGARSARTPPAGRWQKKKGRAGMAVQPKSREETPKVGTPWWAGPGHGAHLDMGVFVLRCNLAPGGPHDLREGCGRLATRGFAKWQRLSFGEIEGRLPACARG